MMPTTFKEMMAMANRLFALGVGDKLLIGLPVSVTRNATGLPWPLSRYTDNRAYITDILDPDRWIVDTYGVRWPAWLVKIKNANPGIPTRPDGSPCWTLEDTALIVNGGAFSKMPAARKALDAPTVVNMAWGWMKQPKTDPPNMDYPPRLGEPTPKPEANAETLIEVQVAQPAWEGLAPSMAHGLLLAEDEGEYIACEYRVQKYRRNDGTGYVNAAYYGTIWCVSKDGSLWPKLVPNGTPGNFMDINP